MCDVILFIGAITITRACVNVWYLLKINLHLNLGHRGVECGSFVYKRFVYVCAQVNNHNINFLKFVYFSFISTDCYLREFQSQNNNRTGESIIAIL